MMEVVHIVARLMIASSVLGCDSGGVSFECLARLPDAQELGGAPSQAACPAQQPCPIVPRDSGGCDDIPEVLINGRSHPAIPLDGGRPYGCRAKLPYDNPTYGSRQTCVCFPKLSNQTDGGLPLGWLCGV